MINEVGKIYSRPWGTYQTLTLEDNYQVKLISVHPSGSLSLQQHRHRSEHWIVIAGSPTLTIGNITKTYQINENVFIPIGCLHRITNNTHETVKIIEIQIGDYLGEDDIIRVEDIYERG